MLFIDMQWLGAQRFDLMMFCAESGPMRTALRLDNNICEAVRTLAAIERTCVGKVLSRLARSALSPNRASRSAPDGFSQPSTCLPTPRP